MRAMQRLVPRPAAVQVAPPSVLRKTPLPQPELLRSLASPVPAHTTLGSAGHTARAPMEAAPVLSKTGWKLAPASVVFITPPWASPTYQVNGSKGSTARSEMRPPMTAGPIARAFRGARKAASTGRAGAAAGAAGMAFRARPWAARGSAGVSDRQSARTRGLGTGRFMGDLTHDGVSLVS